jgi:nucleoside phosphorylase
MMSALETAIFGNRDGSHQLLSSSLPTATPILDILRFLVDRPSGHIGSEVIWSPYWGCGSFEGWWVLWRGEEDSVAPRKNMVKVSVVLMPIERCGMFDNFDELLRQVGYTKPEEILPLASSIAAQVVDFLAQGQNPAIVPNLDIAPPLLCAIWSRLWPSARASLSLRTFFGIESLESNNLPQIVIIPPELRSRWQSKNLLEGNESPNSIVARWFSGENGSPQLTHLLLHNQQQLPADLRILGRLERIIRSLEKLNSNFGKASDAWSIIRVIESFERGITLPDSDLAIVFKHLCQFDDVVQIRSASLTRLDIVESREEVQAAIANWIARKLPSQKDTDALWILEQQAENQHSEWWRFAVEKGLIHALQNLSREWSLALWRWWGINPSAITWVELLLSSSNSTEDALFTSFPNSLSQELFSRIIPLCKYHQWQRLLAQALHSSLPLSEAVEHLRTNIVSPSSLGLEILLQNQDPIVIVQTAASIDWLPLSERAIVYTLKNPSLLVRIHTSSKGHLRLLANHLASHGQFPQDLCSQQFANEIFAGVIASNKSATTVLEHASENLAPFILSYPDAEKFWTKITGRFKDLIAQMAGKVWLHEFIEGKQVKRPHTTLVNVILNNARMALRGQEIQILLSFLSLFPEVKESAVNTWLIRDTYRWQKGDDEKLGSFLLAREWKDTVKHLKWSRKSELISASWHAQELLFLWEKLYWPRHFLPEISLIQANTTNVSEAQANMTIDIGILTMKEEEYEALLDKLEPRETISGANRDYDVASIETTQGQCRVAITRCALQGNTYAQNAASELLSDLHPRFILVVGIGGGIPTPDFCLGDVIVSSYIQDLTLEDTGTSSTSRRYDALGGPLHTSATRIVESIRSLERKDRSWNDQSSIGRDRPGIDGQFTTENQSWNNDIETALQTLEKRTDPISTAKKIASSDRLIKDPELITNWRSVLKGIAAVEMESAGVYLLCQREKVPVLAIRGISDIVGWRRDEAWTIYACHTAAACTLMLIKSGVFLKGS